MNLRADSVGWIVRPTAIADAEIDQAAVDVNDDGNCEEHRKAEDIVDRDADGGGFGQEPAIDRIDHDDGHQNSANDRHDREGTPKTCIEVLAVLRSEEHTSEL